MNRACLPSLCKIALGVALACAPAWAQVEITSSPNPVGSGARALGMGGAFVAIADDATAASWNPGGLVQLERPEASLVLSNKWYGEEFDSESHHELKIDESVNIEDINYASFVYPIKHTIAGRNLVFSLNYQRKYDFGRDLDFRLELINGAGGAIVDNVFNVKYAQSGQLNALSPAFGIELLDNLSVGVAWNIWNSDLIPTNHWENTQDTYGRLRVNGKLFGGSFAHSITKESYDDFRANNFTFGVLYKPNPRWSIGATYNTKFTADIRYTRELWQFISGVGTGVSKRSWDLEYTFPSSFALGVAYRFPNDKLTLSFDVTRREWDQFIINDPNNPDFSKRRRSGVTGQYIEDAPDIKPVYTARLGMEYVFVNPTKPRQDYLPSIRAGVFYDPEPSGGREMNFWGTTKGNGKPEPFYGFSLGTGVLIKDRVNIDFAYTLRTGHGVRSDTFGNGVAGTDGDVTQHLIYLSTVIYF